MSYYVGSLAKLTAAFTDCAGAAADPTVVTLTIIAPNGVSTTYTYPTGIVKDSAGNYHYNLAPTAAGRWSYEWQGTGSVVAAQPGTIDVLPFPQSFTYDFTAAPTLSTVRLLVADTDYTHPVFSDAEINAAITMTASQSLYISGHASPTGARVQVPTVPQVYSVYRAAAILLDSLASNKSRLSSVVKILDVQLSPEKAAANLRETANGYRYTEDHSGQFAIAEMVPDQFSARERVWKMNVRLYS